jgi:hypothetical protein
MVDDVIFEKALTTEKFIKDIENLVTRHNLDYMDAVVHYCEKNNIEIEAAAMIIRNNSPSVKIFTSCQRGQSCRYDPIRKLSNFPCC